MARERPGSPSRLHTIESILDILGNDTFNNLPPLRDEGVLESIVSHLKNSEKENCPSSPDCSELKVVRRRTYKRRPTPSPDPMMERRNSTWTSTIRSYLNNKASKSLEKKKQELSQMSLVESSQVPQTEKELDKFLLFVWGNKHTGPNIEMDHDIAAEIEELERFYDRKLSELKQNYKVHLSELSHLADTSCTAHKDRELLAALHEAKTRLKCFDRLRFDLKEQVAKTIVSILPESVVLSKKIPSKAVRVMNEWFHRHMDYPYPTARQKEVLASKCAVTSKQVSNWFGRRRTSSKPKSRLRSRPLHRRRARNQRKKRPKRKLQRRGKRSIKERLVIRRIRTLSGQ